MLVKIDTENGDSNNVIIAECRYSIDSVNSYSVDIIDDNELVEEIFSYSAYPKIIESNNLRITYTSSHSFDIVALNNYYLYVMPFNQGSPYVRSQGKNGSFTAYEPSNGTKFTCLVTKNELTVIPS